MIKNMIHPKTAHAFQSVPRALAPTELWVPKRHFCPVTASSIGIAARQFLVFCWHGVSFTTTQPSRVSVTGRDRGAEAFLEQDAAGQWNERAAAEMLPNSVSSLRPLLITD